MSKNLIEFIMIGFFALFAAETFAHANKPIKCRARQKFRF